jgi:elongation factor P hydroxylase
MQASTTMTISEGASTFSLPSDFKSELNPEVSDYETTGYRRLVKIIENGIDQRSTSDSGRPLNYRVWEEQGRFLIQADDSFTFPMEYFKYFADLDNDTETSDADFQKFLNRAHEAIEYYALARCYERLQNFNVARYYQNDAPDLPLGKFELKYKQLRKEDIDIALANMDLQMGYPG